MGSSQSNSLPECYLCGAEAETIDHVPPQGLFPRVPANIIEVPACLRCNRDVSRDEEYMRATLAALGYWHSSAAREIWRGEIARSFQYTQGLRRRLAGDIRDVEVRSSTGELLGVLPGLGVDGRRALNVFRKIASGIYYFEKHTRIPDNELILFRMAEVPPRTINTAGWPEHDIGEVFRYRSQHDTDGSSIWFEFYRRDVWLALTGSFARNYRR